MEELLEILRNVKPGVDFEKETKLIDDGVLDSLDIISIISEIDDAFGVALSPVTLTPENFNSAAAIYETIQAADED